MVKTFKSLLFWSQRSYDLETWFVASGTQALQIYMNDDPEMTLTYFMPRSNLDAYTFEWGKLSQKSFKGKNLQQITKFLNNYVYEKIWTPGSVGLYTCI